MKKLNTLPWYNVKIVGEGANIWPYLYEDNVLVTYDYSYASPLDKKSIIDILGPENVKSIDKLIKLYDRDLKDKFPRSSVVEIKHWFLENYTGVLATIFYYGKNFHGLNKGAPPYRKLGVEIINGDDPTYLNLFADLVFDYVKAKTDNTDNNDIDLFGFGSKKCNPFVKLIVNPSLFPTFDLTNSFNSFLKSMKIKCEGDIIQYTKDEIANALWYVTEPMVHIENVTFAEGKMIKNCVYYTLLMVMDCVFSKEKMDTELNHTFINTLGFLYDYRYSIREYMKVDFSALLRDKMSKYEVSDDTLSEKTRGTSLGLWLELISSPIGSLNDNPVKRKVLVLDTIINKYFDGMFNINRDLIEEVVNNPFFSGLSE